MGAEIKPEFEMGEKKNNWLYGIIALLVLALVIETGFLISRNSRSKEKTEPRPKREKIFTGSPYAASPYGVPAIDMVPRDWDPFQEMIRMQREMNRLFDETFGRTVRKSRMSGFGFGNFELQETDKAYIVKVDLPGLEKDKIEVNISGNLLTIQGERKEETQEEDERQGIYTYTSERSYGAFHRTFTLPGPVDEANVKADYKNGVLTLNLAKLQEKSPRKKIHID